MKKRGLLGIGAAVVLCLFASMVFAQGQGDLQNHPSCKYCGMEREKFGHSRVYIEYEDGTTVGTCSIRCAAVELCSNIDKTPKTVWVGDYETKKLIDVEKAFWVIGGSKPGVMTKQAKWAFEKEDGANKFIKENGGEIATFDGVIKAAYEDMYADTKMIRDRRKMKKQQQVMEQKTMEHKPMEHQHQ